MNEKIKVVPVVVLENQEEAIRQLSALKEGNLLVAEITFRTAYAKDGIKFACENFPEIYVGAGTIINETQAVEAIEAGAKFIVSPGIDEKIAKVCADNGIEYIPGCVTPTEIMKAISLNLKIVKFFPANVYGGIKAIKSLAAPFKQVKFLPTGGVDENNIDEYLSCDKVCAVGATYIMKGDIVANCKKIAHLLGD